ncbi:MAG: hypothetical protein HYY18_22945 [Planctomycetes bacterium]|nr:hypothetical protein [Planctomycetota bacterium]
MLRTLVVAFLMAVSVSAQSPPAKDTLERFRQLRPGDEDLAMYRLDWAPSFEAAQRRAAKEKRPVLLVVIHAKYGDMISGHC